MNSRRIANEQCKTVFASTLTLCVILFTLAKMMAEMNPAYKMPMNASKEVTKTTKTHSLSSFSVLKAGQVLP